MSKIFTIKRILSKPSSTRLDFEFSELLQIFKRLALFQRCLELDQAVLAPVFRDMELKTYKKDEPVFTAGQVANALYIVLQGKAIEVFQRKERKQRVLTLSKVLGEIEVIFGDEVYVPSCRCESVTLTLIRIGRSELNKGTNAHKMISLSSIYNFVERHEIFQRLSAYDKKVIAFTMSTKKFQPGEVILRADRPCSQLLFIKRGKVGVRKVVNRYEEGPPLQIEFDQIEEYSVFGEYQIINKVNSEVSLVALNYGEYLLISYGFLVELAPQLASLIEEKARVYPSLQHIIEIFLYRLKEERQRQQILKREGFYEPTAQQRAVWSKVQKLVKKYREPQEEKVSEQMNKLLKDIFRAQDGKDKRKEVKPRTQHKGGLFNQTDVLINMGESIIRKLKHSSKKAKS